MGGRVARMGQRGVAYRVLVEKSEGRRQLGKHRCKWKNNNIKRGLQEGRWGHGLD